MPKVRAGPMVEPSKYLNVRDVARRFGVHENTVRNWERRGILRAVRLPGSGYRRFDARDVDRMWKEMTSQLAPADERPLKEPREIPRGTIQQSDLV